LYRCHRSSAESGTTFMKSLARFFSIIFTVHLRLTA
jgi:hypothetical protein